MSEHVLKCWSVYWDAIERGDKNFEVRRDDRGFQKGDTLVLRRFNRDRYVYEFDNGQYRELRRIVSYILTGGQFGIEPGYVVMALSTAPETRE